MTKSSTSSNTQFESVAKVLIINPLNQALILTIGEHTKLPERSFTPDLPGGLVENNESEKEGAIRETLEEANIVLNPENVHLIYAKTEFNSAENKSISKFFYVCTLDQTPVVTLSWEHSAYEWMPISELRKNIPLRSFYKEAVAYLFSNELLDTLREKHDGNE